MHNSRKLSIADRTIGVSLMICLTIMEGLHFSGSFGITSSVFIFCFFYYSFDKKFLKIATSWPLLIWLTLTLYHYINAQYIHHVPDTNFIDLLHGLRMYSCIAIFAYFACIDYKETVKILLDSYILKSLFVLLFLFSEGYSGVGRLSGAGASATGLGQNAALTCIFLVYYNCFNKQSIRQNIQYLIIPVVVILLSQTRNAFAMATISILSLLIVKQSMKTKSFFLTTVLVILSALFVFAIASYFLQDSSLFSRFAEGEQYDDAKLATGSVFDKIVGDRLVYYVLGWYFLVQSPLTGIGMWNYKFMTGGRFPLHSEYMVHLCEGGIIGFVLWVSFLLFIFFIIWKYIKLGVYKWCAISSIVVLLFCAIYAREFFEEVFYPPYSLVIAWYCSKKIFRHDLNKRLQK